MAARRHGWRSGPARSRSGAAAIATHSWGRVAPTSNSSRSGRWRATSKRSSSARGARVRQLHLGTRGARPTAPARARGARVGQLQLGTGARVGQLQLGPGGARVRQLQLGCLIAVPRRRRGEAAACRAWEARQTDTASAFSMPRSHSAWNAVAWRLAPPGAGRAFS
jgi:hypothetical protein